MKSRVRRIFLNRKALCLCVLALSFASGVMLAVNDRFLRLTLRRPFASIRPSPCGADFDVAATVDKLKIDRLDPGDAYHLLVDHANASPACRTEVISELTDAMADGHPDMISDRPGLNLWFHGPWILTDLHSTESLDLLMDHLDLNDLSYSTSLNDFPVMQALIRFGDVAVPKLGLALQHNKDISIRRDAAVCLANIGGQAAMDTMRQALNNEKDPGIRHLLEDYLTDTGDE
jgi:hypothetical protein